MTERELRCFLFGLSLPQHVLCALLHLESKRLLCLLQLSSLRELVKQLKKQLSREKSGCVQTRLKALLQRRDMIKELSARRREELKLSKMLCVFKRDVGEVTNQKASM